MIGIVIIKMILDLIFSVKIYSIIRFGMILFLIILGIVNLIYVLNFLIFLIDKVIRWLVLIVWIYFGFNVKYVFINCFFSNDFVFLVKCFINICDVWIIMLCVVNVILK